MRKAVLALLFCAKLIYAGWATVHGLYYPEYIPANAAIGGSYYQNFLIDAAGEKVAMIVRAPKTGTLNRAGFLLGTVTAGDTLKVSFQDVDPATGDPDGTADQYRTVAIADTDDDKWIGGNSTPALGVMTSDGTDSGLKRSVTQGDLLAVVIEFDNRVNGNLNVRHFGTPNFSRVTMMGQSYVDHYTTSWVKASVTGSTACGGIVLLEYDDGSSSYIPGTLPAASFNYAQYHINSTPDEAMLRFSLPFPAKVTGYWFGADLDGDAELFLLDSGGSVVANSTVSLDKDIRAATAGSVFGVLLANEITLAANTTYYLSLKPTTASALMLYYFNAPSNAAFGQASCGTACYWAQRVDGGAITTTDTRRPLMGLILSAVSDGAGGGGGGTGCSHTFVQ